MFIRRRGAFPALNRVTGYGFAVIRYAFVRINNEHFAEPVTLRACSDRMVVGEEGRTGTFDRDLAVSAVEGVFEDVRLVPLVRVVRGS